MKKTTHYGLCPRCNGGGEVAEPAFTSVKSPCPACHGIGRIVVGETIETEWPDEVYTPPKTTSGTAP